MKIVRCLGGALVLLLHVLCARGEDGAVVVPLPPEPTAVTYAPSKWHAEHNPACQPCCYAYNHWAIPFELMLRTGPSFVIGGNRFDDALKHGIAVELGVKHFHYNPEHSAAWTIELGLALTYNEADGALPQITRRETLTGTDNDQIFGGTTQLPNTVTYGITALRRMYIRLAGGHEWYYGAGPHGGAWVCGVDAGGRIGHAHATIDLISRVLDTPGDLVGLDSITGDAPAHETDVVKGLFAGVHAGVLYPCWGYDVFFGLRGEIGRDWLRISHHDKSIDEAKLLLSAGVRF